MLTTELHTSILGAGLLFWSMGGREDSKNITKALEMENLSLDISKSFSRDLLQRFMGSVNEHGTAKNEDEEELELNLGLSMGGRFGVDKSPKKLSRSSSIASCLPVVRDDNDAAVPPPATFSGLARTSSLPVETEEEWRKRKELQTLRRMEAKRRRSEKQRNLRSEREVGGSGSLSLEDKKDIEMNLRAKLEREKSLTALKRSGSSAQFGQSIMDSSSSLSDFGSKNLQGSSGEVSPGSIQSATLSRDTGGSMAAKAKEIKSKGGGSDMDSPSSKRSGAEEMPCVFTKGDGPNGRRVDGILYRYGKGEEVRIMCICHGGFHSPAEFVQHAGGTDTANPLKHIVVNPNSSSPL